MRIEHSFCAGIRILPNAIVNSRNVIPSRCVVGVRFSMKNPIEFIE